MSTSMRILSSKSLALSGFNRMRSRQRSKVTVDEAKHILEYLEDPVRVGLWRLSAKWVSNSGVSFDLWNDIEKEINGRDVIQIRTGRRERKLRVTEEWKEEIRTRVFDRITFLMTLFQFLAQQASGQAESQDASETDSDEDQTVLDLVDTRAIAEKYAEALEFFDKQLCHQSFSPKTVLNVVTRIKSGSFILLNGPAHGSATVLISWSREPLEAMAQFLKLLGKIQDIELMPVFSPEEEAFAPYFDLFGLVREHLVRQEHLGPIVDKALGNFSEANFTEAISSLGLAGEDVLTQVFETFFREQLNKGLTLGQLVDEINARTAAYFPKKEENAPDLSTLYNDINQAIASEPDSVASLHILRKTLGQIIESNKFLTTKIDKIGQTERKISIFPARVQLMLTELIRYRNAASHRSRVPLGPYESRRAAFAFVVLYSWWDREKRAIDWSRSPAEIVIECAKRAGQGQR
ncbi:MAG: hypothetical protein ACK4OE_04925 [Acidovorax sp.]|uniref:hypothetical protein n=1 Tax=Acidovorax sp. TaxID=1872122 RepID=UPI0039187C39